MGRAGGGRERVTVYSLGLVFLLEDYELKISHALLTNNEVKINCIIMFFWTAFFGGSTVYEMKISYALYGLRFGKL